MTDDKPRVIRLLKCASHGDRKWQGHVMCEACGKIYQTSDPKKPRFAPPTCPCGQLLMPPDRGIGDAMGMHGATVIKTREDLPNVQISGYDGVDFTARPICYLCYRHVDKKMGGRVPVEKGRVN